MGKLKMNKNEYKYRKSQIDNFPSLAHGYTHKIITTKNIVVY